MSSCLNSPSVSLSTHFVKMEQDLLPKLMMVVVLLALLLLVLLRLATLHR